MACSLSWQHTALVVVLAVVPSGGCRLVPTRHVLPEPIPAAGPLTKVEPDVGPTWATVLEPATDADRPISGRPATSTPMLDAALARARDQATPPAVVRSAVPVEVSPTAIVVETTLPPVETPAPESVPVVDVPRPVIVIPDVPAFEPVVLASLVREDDEHAASRPIDLEPIALAVSALATEPEAGRTVPGPSIGDLALCRRVRGFADFEAIDAGTLRPGQPLLVYCQMDGLHYEPIDDDAGFRSRLASRVEILPDRGVEPIWSQAFEPAEDVCRRPRHDYFASYPIRLPLALTPGTYRLRLVQGDILADREVSRELMLTIRP